VRIALRVAIRRSLPAFLVLIKNTLPQFSPLPARVTEMIHRGSADVWRVRIDAIAALPVGERAERIEMWRGMLSAEERRRADLFLADGHRHEYVAAHAVLRYVLGMYLKVLPSAVRIVTLEGTKPALAAEQVADRPNSDLRFNLSHTRGAVLIGISIGREVGIDIEWQRPMEDLEAMARSVMSDQELGLWKVLRPESRPSAFYEVWTRKESYLKAIGLGLYRSLQDVTVPVSEGAGDESPGLVLDRSGQGSWRVLGIPAWDGYSAAVCWEGDDVPLVTVRDLDILQCDLSGIGELG